MVIFALVLSLAASTVKREHVKVVKKRKKSRVAQVDGAEAQPSEPGLSELPQKLRKTTLQELSRSSRHQGQRRLRCVQNRSYDNYEGNKNQEEAQPERLNPEEPQSSEKVQHIAEEVLRPEKEATQRERCTQNSEMQLPDVGREGPRKEVEENTDLRERVEGLHAGSTVHDKVVGSRELSLDVSPTELGMTQGERYNSFEPVQVV